MKEEAYNQTDSDTGHKREIKCKVSLFNQDITGQFPKPRNFDQQRHINPSENQKTSDDNQYFSNIYHLLFQILF